MRSIRAIVLLCSLFLSVPFPAQGADKIPECSIDQGPCSRTVAGREIVLDISPRPVKAMKELTFTIRAINRSTAPSVLLDLSMPGMYMGRNEVVLKKTADGSYRGDGILPRCPSGKRLWRAEATIPGIGKVFYLFNVNQ